MYECECIVCVCCPGVISGCYVRRTAELLSAGVCDARQERVNKSQTSVTECAAHLTLPRNITTSTNKTNTIGSQPRSPLKQRQSNLSHPDEHRSSDMKVLLKCFVRKKTISFQRCLRETAYDFVFPMFTLDLIKPDFLSANQN